MARPEISASMPDLLQLALQKPAGVVHVALALGALLGDELLDLVVLARVKALEREVLELPLDRVNPQPMGERRVDLERLACLLDLLLLRQPREGAHVVQAVGELDQDDPEVRGHRDHHLSVVLGLALVAALEGDLGELGDPVDELGNRVAEQPPDLLQAGARVLDRVVKQRRAQGLRVEPEARADLRHLHGVGDEVLAGAPPLIGVALAGEGEGALGCLGVDPPRSLEAVLLDHRQQIAQQRALVVGQRLRALGERRHGRALAAAGADPGVTPAVGRGHGAVGPARRQLRRALPRSPRIRLARLSLPAQESPALLVAVAVGDECLYLLEVLRLRGYDAEGRCGAGLLPADGARLLEHA